MQNSVFKTIPAPANPTLFNPMMNTADAPFLRNRANPSEVPPSEPEKLIGINEEKLSSLKASFKSMSRSRVIKMSGVLNSMYLSYIYCLLYCFIIYFYF